MNDPLLEARLRPLARRQRALRLGSGLAVCWMATALAGLVLALLIRALGFAPGWALFPVALAGVVMAFGVGYRLRRAPTDWQALARMVEARHPELDGRLLTAIEQVTVPGGEPGYLQRRLSNEALDHSRFHEWGAAIPSSRVTTARAAQVLALALLALVFSSLLALPPAKVPIRLTAGGVTVTPGDIALERGQSLVVMARFGGVLPAQVDLVVVSGGEAKRVPLVRSLSDPLFGGTISEVTSDFRYHLAFGGQRTRDYQVRVFEYPRLERADAALTYPAYTRLAPQRIENTLRVSAVEGTLLDLALQLNKPVLSARLVPRTGDRDAWLLRAETNRPMATLAGLKLTASQTLALELVDADGRTNQVPATFVLNVLTNRTPELKLASPRGDLRPSSIEEIRFEGSVWDDFGVEAYGLAYTLVGHDPESVELGRAVAAKEHRPFHHLLRLEDLGLEPDQLIAWHVWADDIGPDGQVRRTVGDLFFGEIRPFDEIYREGQGRGDQAQQQQAGEDPSGEGGNPSTRLAELQKQIIGATWKLQREGASSAGDKKAESPAGTEGKTGPATAYAQDAAVVREAQAQALEQGEAALDEVDDPRTAAFWKTATDQMKDALEHLEAAAEGPGPLPAALAAEQAAYEALLKLQQREFEVARSRRSQRGQPGSRQQQVQRQLDQLDLTQSEDRYETERQAQAPQSPERREQLQVLNRLQELARRQQEVNERLRELQTALEEARTEPEREEIRRQLKRLEEEEQQMLADADELRERLDRPENQSRLAEPRQQVEQARQEMQRAAEAAGQEAVSQALAAGTRAQRQMQQARDDLRRATAGEFAEDLRTLRGEARALNQEQAAIDQALEALSDSQRKTLSDAAERQALLERLDQQRARLTNVTERATQLSQQTEEAEPLVSRELYDSLRQFTQDEAATIPQLQEELLERGMLTQRTYDRLRDSAENAGAKSLEATAEMLRLGYLPQADRAEERARAGIDALRRGIERAAERVLGDDAEELRLAQRELEALTGALEREIAANEPGGTNATAQASGTARPGRDPDRDSLRPENSQAQASAPEAADRGGEPGRAPRPGDPSEARPEGGGGLLSDALDRVLGTDSQEGTGPDLRPLTGDGFAPWSDRLREVEELVDLPTLRSEIAQARERARRARVEYKRDLKKPDWAVVRLEIVRPLVEVGQQIAEELARREPKDALVPIDRDPVPSRFSELVRRYYEDLGQTKSGGPR